MAKIKKIIIATKSGVKKLFNIRTAIILWIVIFTGLTAWGIRTNREATAINKELIIKVARNSAEIQQERKESIRRNCKDSNERHDKTLSRLKQLLSKSPQSEAEKTATFKSTEFIINALVPKQDCEKLVERSVSPN